MTEPVQRGVLDTSVLIDLPHISEAALPLETTAVANELPLYTRNPRDFSAVHAALQVHAV